MSEDLYSIISKQAEDEVISALHTFPSKPILMINSKFVKYMIRLLSRKTITQKFGEIKVNDQIEPTEDEGAVMAFTPNDPFFLKDTIEQLKKLPKYRKKLMIFPRYGVLCQSVVENSGIEKEIQVVEFHFDLLPLDSTQFIIPAPNTFKNCFIDSTTEDLVSIARALSKIEVLHGVFPKVVAFGDCSNQVAHILEEIRSQVGEATFYALPSFHSLYIIDRTADIFTPLLTQFTYGSVLNTLADTTAGILEIPKDVEFESNEIILSDEDEPYKMMRDLQITDAADVAQSMINEIQNSTERLRQELTPKEFKYEYERGNHLADIKPLVNLHLSLMFYYTNIIASSKTFNPRISFELATLMGSEPHPELADQLISEDIDYKQALILYCIASVCRRGIPLSVINNIRKKYINKFGFDFLEDLDNLERVGLLAPMQGSFFRKVITWRTIASEFNLIAPDRTSDPVGFGRFCSDDLGSFYDGYTPLSVRLVQYAAQGKIEKEHERVLTELRAAMRVRANQRVEALYHAAEAQQAKSKHPKPRRILVIVVGGVTDGERAAFRALGRSLGDFEVHVGSTRVLADGQLLEEACPHLST